MKKQLTLKTRKVSRLTQNESGDSNQKLTPIVVKTLTLISPIFK